MKCDKNIVYKYLAAEDVKKYFLSSGSEYELYRFYSDLLSDAALNRLMERYPIIEGITFVGSDGRAYTYSASSSSLIDYDIGSINAVRQLIAEYPDPSDILGTQVLVSGFPAKNGGEVNYISFARYVRRNDDPSILKSTVIQTGLSFCQDICRVLLKLPTNTALRR